MIASQINVIIVVQTKIDGHKPLRVLVLEQVTLVEEETYKNFTFKIKIVQFTSPWRLFCNYSPISPPIFSD